jgi:hypothetical protein
MDSFTAPPSIEQLQTVFGVSVLREILKVPLIIELHGCNRTQLEEETNVHIFLHHTKQPA